MLVPILRELRLSLQRSSVRSKLPAGAPNGGSITKMPLTNHSFGFTGSKLNYRYIRTA